MNPGFTFLMMRQRTELNQNRETQTSTGAWMKSSSSSSPVASRLFITVTTGRYSIHHPKHFPLAQKDVSHRPIMLMSSFSLKS